MSAWTLSRPSSGAAVALTLLIACRSLVAAEGGTTHSGPSMSESPNLNLTLEHQITLVPRSAGPHRAAVPDAGDFTVSFDGRPQEVLELEPIEAEPPVSGDSWQLVVYADPALSSPAGLRAATEGLARAAGRLTSLGPVEVVVADPFAEPLLEASSSVEDLLAALSELALFADGAGEMLALREERARLEAEIDEELELLEERRLELLRWLASRRVAKPSCLLLLQDGFDLRTPLAGVTSSDRATTLSEAHHQWATILASSGWTVFPLAAESAANDLLPGRLEALEVLAEASGGEVLTDLSRLTDLLAPLAQAYLLRVRISGRPDGVPRPLDVRESTLGSGFRSPRWATPSTPLALSEMRIFEALQEPGESEGGLETLAVLRPGPRIAEPRGNTAGILEAMAMIQPDIGSGPLFRVSWLLIGLEGNPLLQSHEVVDPGDLRTATAWLYRQHLILPDELADGAVVIEELRSGLWGAAALDYSDTGLPTVAGKIIEWSSPSPVDLPTGAVQPRRDERVVIRLLPPRRRPARGRVRFDTLVSSPRIARVDFYLDGELAATDDHQPFSATIDLGSEASTHTIRAVAYASGEGPLGSHEIIVNPADDSFRVSTEIARPPGGLLRVRAHLRVPTDRRLDRVEFYWNEVLVGTLTQAPFEFELPAPHEGSQDYVRVVAHLADGTWMDDARLLTDSGIAERLDVNLVELHVVVSDRDGTPIRGLAAGDFTVELRGQAQTIERLAPAEAVPLVLGVVIDTSESMWPLMIDTQKAGAQFVADTLTEGDSAFLVDFDTRPRLAQGTTPDVMRLLRTFSDLRADGFTALYDAVIFSMLQFEEAEGRKALVLLTDGDDYRSRYSPRRCIQYGRRLGVPVYIISLAGIQNPRRNLRRIDLEGITEGTGGRVYYISQMEQLGDAYSRINDELRSQYVLTFSTDRALSEEELDSIEVGVGRKGLSVRAVVGRQQVQ